VFRHNGRALGAKLAERRKPDKGAADAIADLEDWITDTETKVTTGVAGEALVMAKRALLLGESGRALRAYALMELLEDREVKTPGRDIAASHTDPNKPYLAVVATLQDCLLAVIRKEPDQSLSR
jgi:predicted glutamine amidotransferase